ncbi:MAG: DEAD/DEAH box helicase, partial [Persicimonas sp.]
LKALRKVGYKRPTPVQTESIPLILAGIDLIVQSQTGSGKTAAFAIPTIEMLDPHPGRVEVLVLAPTRELAKQVSREFARLGQFKDLEATAIYGGASYEKQYKALETAQIVAATPGRLLDLAKREAIDLSTLRILCLDEADEMLSMGFREELNAIVDFLPEERQSLLFSATVDEDIKALAKGMLYYPEYISLSGDQVAAEAVEHTYYRVRGVGRERDLIRVLEYETPESALIFCNTRADTFTVTEFLKRHDYRAEVLNGELPQKQREKTLAALREGKVDYIVATDVAARGIDITDLSHVINYTLPSSAEIYVHRTGRTGRAGKSGRAVSLVSPAEMATHFDIMTLYDIDIEHRDLPDAEEIVEAQEETRLSSLSKHISRLESIPYGGKLGMARQLLEEGDDSEEHVRLLARLLSLGQTVVEDPKKLDVVTGRAALATAGAEAAAKTTAEAGASDTRQPAEKTPPKVEKSAPKETSRDQKPAPKPEDRSQDTGDDSDGGRKRSRGAKTPTPDAPKERESEDSGQQEDQKRRRRKRTRGSKGASRRGAQRRGDDGGSSDKKTRRSSDDDQKAESSDADKTAPSADQSGHTDDPDFPTSKMYMNVGRDHFEDSEELLDMICYMSGFAPEDFGEVAVMSSYSFVHVRETYFYDIIKALNNQEWNGVKLTAEPARN